MRAVFFTWPSSVFFTSLMIWDIKSTLIKFGVGNSGRLATCDQKSDIWVFNQFTLGYVKTRGGVTKAPFVHVSITDISDIIESYVSVFKTRSYLTGVFAARKCDARANVWGELFLCALRYIRAQQLGYQPKWLNTLRPNNIAVIFHNEFSNIFWFLWGLLFWNMILGGDWRYVKIMSHDGLLSSGFIKITLITIHDSIWNP